MSMCLSPRPYGLDPAVPCPAAPRSCVLSLSGRRNVTPGPAPVPVGPNAAAQVDSPYPAVTDCCYRK
ncbi:hypothetical protein GCM10010497_25410 [Streptomyces cinereoruber]|uniref:Uncharacterized protein n=1 Tax=Streptomyces cinereoruber TaxID=67260 RepID=A0AAV4KGP8_9ACTN|nr:hypothetical protein GCM10010497_25410 [Streptomyces cinereoruber]